MNWQEYYVNLLDAISLKSKDNTKTSAIIVGANNEIRSTGYNGMPRGMDDYDATKWGKPEKYFWVEHSERNSIYNAARVGVSVAGCDLYASHFPCIDCARAIVNSGIKRVIVSDKNLGTFSDPKHIYREHKQKTIEMFRQCKVELIIHGEHDSEDPELDSLWAV